MIERSEIGDGVPDWEKMYYNENPNLVEAAKRQYQTIKSAKGVKKIVLGGQGAHASDQEVSNPNSEVSMNVPENVALGFIIAGILKEDRE